MCEISIATWWGLFDALVNQHEHVEHFFILAMANIKTSNQLNQAKKNLVPIKEFVPFLVGLPQTWWLDLQD